MYESEKRMYEISLLAEEYANIAIRDNRDERPRAKEIVLITASFTPLEMAYFCNQMVSYCPDVHKATMYLTVFVNRLKDRIEQGSQS